MTSTAFSFRASGMLRLSLATLSLLALQPALAKQDDRNQPMVVEHADKFDGFNAPNTISTITGNVLITQGTMKVTGDLAKIYVDADTQVSRVVVTANNGKLAHIEQLDDNNNLMTGDADQLDYDNINQIAVLTGHAVVHQQGRGEAHGDKLTYNTQTSYITGDSNGNGLVHMVFLPKPKPVKPGATAPATPAAAKPVQGVTLPTAKPASSSSSAQTPTSAPAAASTAPTAPQRQP
ncbi:MAG: lipopolysaccharide transport periplasmic protein LptA [Rhodanobacter sp.]